MDLFSDVETGSKSYYLIKTQERKVYKARVVTVDPDKVLLLLPGGKSMTVNTNDVIEVKKHSYNSNGSVGIGLGSPYGVLGANLDLKLFNVIYATGGIGTSISVTPIYDVGLRCYLRSGNYKFRPRITANYGNTKIICAENSIGDVVKETYDKFYLSAGFLWALNISKSIAFDFDLIYIPDDSKFESRAKEMESQGYSISFANTSDIDFSIGLRYVF